MSRITELLRRNGNYRNVWIGQLVSEIGDYFNNVAVLSMAIETTGSGLVVSGVMLSRAIPAMLAGPVAGVLLDRFDRRRIMIASDVIRAIVALGFLATIEYPRPWVLYLLSAMLMFVSPFFTSGRNSLLPEIASPAELHTANALTRTTEWATLTAGTMVAGFSAAAFGYHWAFVINSASFLFSAAAIARVRLKERGLPARRIVPGVVRPWGEYVQGLRYIRSSPLILGIALLHLGWAMGGGAAQILFTLFGEQVFHRGASGIGTIWGFAGIGLLIGGAIGNLAGRDLGFKGYKRAVTVSYLVHGLAYAVFSLMTSYGAALAFVALSRVGMAVASILNYTQLMRHTREEFRGRVFATMESVRWSMMMLSVAVAGAASEYYSPRAIGVVAGLLGAVTAIAWAWADISGRLPEPREVQNR